MHREYHVVLFSDSTAILRERKTKNCYDLKSKVPSITERLEPNLHCLYRKRREYHVALLSDPTAILGEIRKKNFWTSRVKCTSLLTAFNLTSTPCSACTGSTMWYYLVTPQQSYVGDRRTFVTTWRVKCPPLLNAFNLICTASRACAVSTMWYYSVTPLQS
jgi:hypothetical protein